MAPRKWLHRWQESLLCRFICIFISPEVCTSPSGCRPPRQVSKSLISWVIFISFTEYYTVNVNTANGYRPPVHKIRKKTVTTSFSACILACLDGRAPLSFLWLLCTKWVAYRRLNQQMLSNIIFMLKFARYGLNLVFTGIRSNIMLFIALSIVLHIEIREADDSHLCQVVHCNSYHIDSVQA